MVQLAYGMTLPVQGQSKLMAESWETEAGPSDLARIAVACDRAGFDNVSVCDHVAVPRDLADRMSTVWYDTVATLGWLAAQTDSVKLLSQIYVLPYRPALQTAKSFATLDALSGGRAILGVGVGHVEAEFANFGVPFAERGRRTDEAIATIRAAFSDEWGAGDLGQKPRPAQPGGPPIWVGGSSPAARRRAAELGDGWLPQGLPEIGMEAAVAEIRARREAAGRDGEAFAMGDMMVVHVGEPAFDVGRWCLAGPPEKVAQALVARSAIGITHVQVRLRSRGVDELEEQISAFAADVVPLVAAA